MLGNILFIHKSVFPYFRICFFVTVSVQASHHKTHNEVIPV